MGLPQRTEPVIARLSSRVLEWWRRNPLFVVLWAGFAVAWALRIPAPYGSRWDEFLAGAAWVLLISCGTVGLVGRGRTPAGRRATRPQSDSR